MRMLSDIAIGVFFSCAFKRLKTAPSKKQNKIIPRISYLD
jgi:hypothetical protein